MFDDSRGIDHTMWPNRCTVIHNTSVHNLNTTGKFGVWGNEGSVGDHAGKFVSQVAKLFLDTETDSVTWQIANPIDQSELFRWKLLNLRIVLKMFSRREAW